MMTVVRKTDIAIKTQTGAYTLAFKKLLQPYYLIF
jgi:hypothetical protein